jgi:hypothetical protein
MVPAQEFEFIAVFVAEDKPGLREWIELESQLNVSGETVN